MSGSIRVPIGQTQPPETAPEPKTFGGRIGRYVASAFGYDAAAASNKRRSVSGKIKSEDAENTQKQRDLLSANTRDTVRNFALPGFMIRKHLDYTSSFSFHARTEDDALNARLESLLEFFARPQNCHAHGRHTFDSIIRMSEAHRTVDGDIGLILMRDGTVLPVEADLIKNPDKIPRGETWINGCRVNSRGRTTHYGIWKRTADGRGKEFVRPVRARNLLLHGFFDRFDQVRGISPLAAALNPIKDLSENFEYALAKAKVSQLFALIIKSGGTSAFGVHTDLTTDETDPDKKKYSVKFGKAPQKLELDPGDDASILESQTPSNEFQSFTKYMIELSLKSLDIPTSFYDESHTNFFGSRAAWLHYDRSCGPKRAAVSELLRRITVWRLGLWIEDGTLQLPAGMTLADIRFEWIPRGMPWWDPAKEVKGDLLALGAGLDTPQRICRERGKGDFYDNLRQIGEAKRAAEAEGVELSFALPAETPPEPEE